MIINCLSVNGKYPLRIIDLTIYIHIYFLQRNMMNNVMNNEVCYVASSFSS